jgi:glycosyltransferase involved in cell wall biosynthesis
MMPHDRFMALVGQMDLNLYISLSESYPMTVLESLVAEVPCLTSYTNGYLGKYLAS